MVHQTGARIAMPAAPAQLATARNAVNATLRVVLNWVVIVAAVLIAAGHPSWPAFVAAFIVVSVQQHALGLWMHEGVHWLIAQNRSVNDLLVTVFLSGPLFVPLNAFRHRHFVHHRHLGTDRDTKPVIFSRVDGRNFWLFLLKNCLGLQLVSIAQGYVAEPPGRRRVHRRSRRWALDVAGVAIVQCAVFLLFTLIASPTYYLWLWVLPWLTINRFIAGLRSVIEHQPASPSERHPFTRTLRPSPLDRVLFCRAGFEHHWAHHRYPNVPWFNLAHVDHSEQAPLARRGYLETLLALVRPSPGTA
jgi:fatty acid desaturase